jgi:nitroreductase
MNEVVKTIKSRRCVRQYKPEQISDSDIQTLMDAAILAPNAMCQQKWHFSVIQNKDLLNKMVAVTRENMKSVEFFARRVEDPNYSPFFQAPAVIYVTADSKARFAVIDCSLAAENILLAAESLGIAACIMTSSEFLFASEKGKALKKEMGIPEGYEHVCAISLGYKIGPGPEARPRNKEVYNIVK